MYATLQRSGGVEAVARRLSVSTPLADRLTASLLPLVLGGMRRHLLDDCDPSAGVLALEDLVQSHGGARLAAGVLGYDPIDPAVGQDLAEAILGGPDTHAAVLVHASSQTGAKPEQLDDALRLVAMLAAGYVAARIGAADEIDTAVIAEVKRLVNVDAPANPLDTLLA